MNYSDGMHVNGFADQPDWAKIQAPRPRALTSDELATIKLSGVKHWILARSGHMKLNTFGKMIYTGIKKHPWQIRLIMEACG